MVEETTLHPEVADKIWEMVRRIVECFHPERILLFGSHATGMAGPDSDVDLLVVMNVDGPRRKKLVEMYGLLAGTGVSKDIVLVTPEEVEKFGDMPGSLIQAALHEGKLLYERAP